jgi:murein L,D-transpeptidase YcbB/YkuD
MKAIVGQAYRRTPVFSDKITYLVLNPSWNIPRSIAVKDKLPLIQADPDYLAKQNIRVFQGSGSDLREIDPETIDWSEVHAEDFNFTLRQEPGPTNALGRMKFMFPNRYGVYIHDTPSGELFSRTRRTFSSGCIRIEKPLDLAEFLLKDDPQWTREVIVAAVDRNGEQTVRLPKPVPVHLQYWTAFVGEDGEIHFPNDIYGRHKRVRDALDSGPPCN